MRAAYAALILGLVSGVWLAAQALSTTPRPRPVTVAGALALEAAGVGIDARRSEAVAVLTARCMASRGLSWQPFVERPPTVPDPDLEPIAWAERWGFGISTLVGRPTSEPPPDPNLAAMEALALDDRERYRAALAGTPPADVGCRRSANEAVYALRDRLLAPLKAGLTELDARIAADPGARRAVGAWRRCVAPIADDEAPERRTFGTAMVRRFGARLAHLGRAGASMAGLLALQAQERRMAATLARCDALFAQARARVAGQYEAAFVAEHRQELDRIGAAIRDAEAALPTLPP